MKQEINVNYPMESKHLLWWLFKTSEPLSTLEKRHFDQIGAPDWVWPAFEQRRVMVKR